MQHNNSRILSFVFFCLVLTTFVNCHNWLVTPVSRANQRATQTGCRYGGEGNPTCAGPCDRKVSQMTIAPTVVQRGQTLQIQWNRHNHPGGFIRFAWSPTSDSDSHASFDQRVDHFVCKDVGGCGPTDPSDPTGTPNGLNCGTTITVPEYLTNGAWTLQWAYFGGWYNAGDYYACVDYTVTGGPTGSQASSYFTGGDFTYPNSNKCLFYSTNALHVCTVEPCTNGTFPAGAQSGAPRNVGTSVPNPPPPSPPSTPLTTGRVRNAVTTGSTTGAKHNNVLTTGKITRATTGAEYVPPPPTPVPPPTPTPPPSSASCTLGHQRCAGSNTYQTCTWVSNTATGWSVNQPCPTGLGCHAVQENYIWCY